MNNCDINGIELTAATMPPEWTITMELAHKQTNVVVRRPNRSEIRFDQLEQSLEEKLSLATKAIREELEMEGCTKHLLPISQFYFIKAHQENSLMRMQQAYEAANNALAFVLEISPPRIREEFLRTVKEEEKPRPSRLQDVDLGKWKPQ